MSFFFESLSSRLIGSFSVKEPKMSKNHSLMTKKQLIKEQSAQLFRKKGYKATPMRDIAKAVGMEAASLYNHIKSKQEILVELLMPIAESFSEGMKNINNSSLTSIEKLEKLIGLHVRLTVENPNAISLITGEWVHLENESLTKYSKLRDDYERDFKTLLEDCIQENYLHTVNIDIALFSILSTLHWLYSWYNKHPEISPVELEKQMVDCLLNGLKRN